MRVMALKQIREPLKQEDWPIPQPQSGQVLLKIEACGVCRTDLHIWKGELPQPQLPLILGHQIVGRVEKIGPEVKGISLGQRMGVPWLGWTCGQCLYCQNGQENLCPQAKFTGYTLQGGFAEYTVADVRYCFPLGNRLPAVEVAPLLCAGLIGYRTLSKAGYAPRLGIYGFGAAAHLILQVALYQGRQVYVFTRPGDTQKQEFARRLGAVWAGGSDTLPPEPLDAALIFAPAGEVIPMALQAVRPGGIVVCGGIYMTQIPPLRYEWLWMERRIESVANLTRRDGEVFLALAERIPIRPHVQVYPLEAANQALEDLDQGRLQGAAVLTLEK